MNSRGDHDCRHHRNMEIKMTTTATETTEPQPMTIQEFNARVGEVIDALSDNLGHQWLDDLDERGFWESKSDEEREDDETVLELAFWDAARIVVRDLILHGHQVTVASNESPNARTDDHGDHQTPDAI
jgi:hypothetical protein